MLAGDSSAIISSGPGLSVTGIGGRLAVDPHVDVIPLEILPVLREGGYNCTSAVGVKKLVNGLVALA